MTQPFQFTTAFREGNWVKSDTPSAGRSNKENYFFMFFSIAIAC